MSKLISKEGGVYAITKNEMARGERKNRECNIKNYSIFLKDNYLFSYLEYAGKNYEADTKKMADDSTIQRWWKITAPMQEPLPTRKFGEWWAEMKEVFHID